MLSFPYLFSHGYIPYKDFVFPYPPFLVFILSLIYKIFGYKLMALKIFTWLLILTSDVFIYKIAKSITKKDLFALLAVIFFILTQPFLDGNMLWFDTFLVLPVLLAIYFLLKKHSSANLLLSGIFLAVAALSKQTAFIYILAATIFMLDRSKKRIKNIFYLLAPSLIFGSLFLAYFLITKSFVDFLNWNLIFPFKYWGSYPTYVQFGLGKVDWLIMAGMATIFIALLKKQKLIFLMALGSVVAVYPRFSYYHLAVAVALWAIGFAIILNNYYKKLFIWFGIAAFLFLFSWFKTRIVITWDFGKGDRFSEVDDASIIQSIDSEFNSNQKIYLANINSNVYVYADRLPPAPWYDNYGWYWEVPGQQEKAISLWSKNPPAGIYWRDESQGDWYKPGVYRPKLIYNWVQKNYVKEKEIENGVWLWKKK